MKKKKKKKMRNVKRSEVRPSPQKRREKLNTTCRRGDKPRTSAGEDSLGNFVVIKLGMLTLVSGMLRTTKMGQQCHNRTAMFIVLFHNIPKI